MRLWFEVSFAMGNSICAGSWVHNESTLTQLSHHIKIMACARAHHANTGPQIYSFERAPRPAARPCVAHVTRELTQHVDAVAGTHDVYMT